MDLPAGRAFVNCTGCAAGAGVVPKNLRPATAPTISAKAAVVTTSMLIVATNDGRFARREGCAAAAPGAPDAAIHVSWRITSAADCHRFLGSLARHVL